MNKVRSNVTLLALGNNLAKHKKVGISGLVCTSTLALPTAYPTFAARRWTYLAGTGFLPV